MFKKLKKKLRRAWKWYIKGDYHCEHCPYCWSEYSYEGDGDCGCYIRGELYDTCRLIPPIRFLIGWPRKRKTEYWEKQQYDGIGEYYEQQYKQEDAMRAAILKALENCEVCQRDPEGKLYPFCKSDVVEINMWAAMTSYEDTCHPIIHKPLKQQWKELLRKTWDAFADHFRPYLPRRRSSK